MPDKHYILAVVNPGTQKRWHRVIKWVEVPEGRMIGADIRHPWYPKLDCFVHHIEIDGEAYQWPPCKNRQ